MKLSADGVKIAHYFEQLRLKAYPDPGSRDGKPYTIGWGHTGPDVTPTTVWTQSQADAAFAADIAKFEAGVAAQVHVPLARYQFDALVLFAYNVGLAALSTSTLLRELNGQNYTAVPAQLLRWDKNDGKAMLGLKRRRTAEAERWKGQPADRAIAVAAAVQA